MLSLCVEATGWIGDTVQLCPGLLETLEVFRARRARNSVSINDGHSHAVILAMLLSFNCCEHQLEDLMKPGCQNYYQNIQCSSSRGAKLGNNHIHATKRTKHITYDFFVWHKLSLLVCQFPLNLSYVFICFLFCFYFVKRNGTSQALHFAGYNYYSQVDA